jgi:hypothetical protein
MLPIKNTLKLMLDLMEYISMVQKFLKPMKVIKLNLLLLKEKLITLLFRLFLSIMTALKVFFFNIKILQKVNSIYLRQNGIVNNKCLRQRNNKNNWDKWFKFKRKKRRLSLETTSSSLNNSKEKAVVQVLEMDKSMEL